jgi:hypothetical protein
MLIGGPRGAWHRGFELTYWCDAFNGRTLEELNQRLPPSAELDLPNDLTNPMTLQELQTLGALRGDIELGGDVQFHSRRYDRFGYVWLQTQDSKATAFTRLLFAMRPWYAREPDQLDGLRVVTVADPVAISRAWALELLLDAPDPKPKETPKVNRLTLNEAILDWARTDPGGFLAAAEFVAARHNPKDDAGARRLVDLVTLQANPRAVETRRFLLDRLLVVRPKALVEAARMLIGNPSAVVSVLTRYGYMDPQAIGGYLDRDLNGGD